MISGLAIARERAFSSIHGRDTRPRVAKRLAYGRLTFGTLGRARSTAPAFLVRRPAARGRKQVLNGHMASYSSQSGIGEAGVARGERAGAPGCGRVAHVRVSIRSTPT